jgi:Zn-dependent protease
MEIETMRCPACGTEVSPSALECPQCRRLVHSERLEALAAVAEAARRRDDVQGELTAWRQALDLLPAGSRQHRVIESRLIELEQAHEGSSPPAKGSHGAAWAAGTAGAGLLLLWKLKALVLLVLTKGKLLALGLTKSSTFFSMLASLGVYWTAYGWAFAAGLVGSIYVHEMGHVAALARFGIPATAPMFIPGIGAVVRSHRRPANLHQDAIVGLAGPVWGCAAALAALGIYWATGAPIWMAIAHVGAWINLFNLLPVWQLDGGHAFRALSRTERLLVAAVILGMFLVTREGLLVLLGIVAAARAFGRDAPSEGDRVAFTHFAGLVVLLAWLCELPTPVR